MKLLTLGRINVNIASALAYSQLSPHHHIRKSMLYLDGIYNEKSSTFVELSCGADGTWARASRKPYPRSCLFFLSRVQVYSFWIVYNKKKSSSFGTLSAVRTGLEPATSGVTGRYSNQLNYRTIAFCERLSLNCDAKIVCIFELCKCLDKKMQTFFLFYPRTRV